MQHIVVGHGEIDLPDIVKIEKEDGEKDPVAYNFKIVACHECDFKSYSKEEFRNHVCSHMFTYKKCRKALPKYRYKDIEGGSTEDEMQKKMIEKKMLQSIRDRERYNKNKETNGKYILPPGFSSRLHLLNVLSNIWRSLGNGIWSSFNHHQLCKHSEQCEFCYVRNLSIRTSAGRKKSRNNLEPYEIQTLLDILGGEDLRFKQMVTESFSFMGECEPTIASSSYFLEVSEDNCEDSNLSDIIKISSDLRNLQDKKIIFIFFEKATKIELEDTLVFNSLEFKYACHVQEMNSSNEYKCHFLHNKRIACDDKGAIMPSSTSDNENIKFVVLIKDSMNSDVPRELTYGDTAMKWIKNKSFQAMDKQKYEEHMKKRKGYHIKYSNKRKFEECEDNTSDEVNGEKKKSFHCTFETCSKSFYTKQNLETHNFVHTGIKPFKCEECSKSFSTKQFLKTHYIVHTGIKPFKCDECSKSFSTKQNLLTHKQTHTGIKPYLCDECPKAFSTKQIMQTHKLIHSRNKPFNSGILNKDKHKRKFEESEDNTSDEVKGENKKSFQCTFEMCSKSFYTEQNLKTHIAVHTGIKPFKCDECSKSFSTKHTLLTHKQLHTGIKPFQCEECSISFSTKHTLLIHKQIHTGIKPFHCDECSKSFSTKQTLLTHKQIHTGIKPYLCDECPKTFSTKQILENHKLIHSRIKPFNSGKISK